MTPSRDDLFDRLAIGQLLVGLLREFRHELFAPAAARGYDDVREPHLHIFGSVGVTGIRLTELAARTQLSPATTSELVSDLERLGYLERRPDPTDRRAKLHLPHPPRPPGPPRRGEPGGRDRAALVRLVGEARFAEACATLQAILDELGAESSR